MGFIIVILACFGAFLLCAWFGASMIVTAAVCVVVAVVAMTRL